MPTQSYMEPLDQQSQLFQVPLGVSIGVKVNIKSEPNSFL